MKEIRSIFHPYITRIQNVMGDGIVWLFIRHKLYDELLTSYEYYSRVFIGYDGVLDSLSFFMIVRTTQLEHYMLMPKTHILIAKSFVGTVTFFPLWRGPSEFQNHCVFTFALIYNNHYVMVQLEGEYLMPLISTLWIRRKDLSTTE
uniref:Uncharacterized protein n=1 Tax=Lactuca sativa TaxID=4236 RepID=A0A9R1WE73_LACSA|nr:hypothetical protein LSAT_V11C100025560 [Lactuca sativa]